MKIENYSETYYHDVVRLVENFHKETLSEFDGEFNPAALADTIAKIKENNAVNSFLLIDDHWICQGILAGVVGKSFSSGRELFQEIIWYVEAAFRSHGVRLLLEAEKILKNRGVSTMIMAVLENSKTEKIKRLYERIGYKPMQVHYVKNL